jgi:hypothetical protein
LPRWVALVGGLAFQFTGIIASWVYAGHDGRIIVATLGPLFFFFLHAGIRTLGPCAWFAGAAGTLGVRAALLPDPERLLPAAGGGDLVVFCLVLRRHRTGARRHRAGRWRWGWARSHSGSSSRP